MWLNKHWVSILTHSDDVTPLIFILNHVWCIHTTRWSKRGYRSSRSRFKTNRDRDRSLYWVETVIKQMTTYMSHWFCFWKVQRKLSALEFSHFSRENDYSVEMDYSGVTILAQWVTQNCLLSLRKYSKEKGMEKVVIKSVETLACPLVFPQHFSFS